LLHFQHENIIGVKDIIRAGTLEGMQNLYIVQVWFSHSMALKYQFGRFRIRPRNIFCAKMIFFFAKKYILSENIFGQKLTRSINLLIFFCRNIWKQIYINYCAVSKYQTSTYVIFYIKFFEGSNIFIGTICPIKTRSK